MAHLHLSDHSAKNHTYSCSQRCRVQFIGLRVRLSFFCPTFVSCLGPHGPQMLIFFIRPVGRPIWVPQQQRSRSTFKRCLAHVVFCTASCYKVAGNREVHEWHETFNLSLRCSGAFGLHPGVLYDYVRSMTGLSASFSNSLILKSIRYIQRMNQIN